MAIKRVSISLIKDTKVTEIEGFALGVREAIFILNPNVFKGIPPTTYDAMGDIITTFTEKRAIYKQGGTAALKPYTDALKALMDCLLSFAPYVNKIANGDEDNLKLSKLPYTGAVNKSGKKISEGAVAKGVLGQARNTGILTTTCSPFGENVEFIAIAVQGKPLPIGTKMSLDGQILLPVGEDAVPYVLNINGKRDKTFVELIPGVIYYVYYVMICGGFVSALSEPKKLSCGG